MEVAVTDTTAVAPPPPAGEAVAQRINPYVGPRSFKMGEKLYGRDREALDLLDLLIAERIVLLYSPSGAGKSSLLQAELLPRLVEEGFHVLPPIRVSMEPPSLGEGISVANRYIFSALLSLEEGLAPNQQIPLAELATMDLDTYLRRRPRPDDAPDSDVLLFDQFEEILTVDPSNQAAKIAFFAQVGAALRDRGRWALFAMREDYVAGLDPFLRPIPTRFKTTFRLDLLGEAAARLAMQAPARAAGVEFTDAAAKKLVDDLRRVRVQQGEGHMEEQIGLHVEPVQLQVVCHRLWNGMAPDDDQVDEEDVAAVGDVDSALAGYYEDRIIIIAEATGVRERKIRDWFETQLITEQGIRGQVLQSAGQSAGLENRVIRQLIDVHLVRGEKRRGATWFELAHDRLIEPVRKSNAAWREAHLSPLQRQAALWEEQDRPEGLLLRDAALDDAEGWAAEHADELTQVDLDFLDACRRLRARVLRARRTQRLIQSLLIVATTLFVLSAVLAVLALDALNQSRRQARIATERQLVAQADSLLETNPQRGLLLALEAQAIRREVGPELGSEAEDSLRRLLVNTGGRVLHAGDRPIGGMAISPDSRWLVAVDLTNDARLWDLRLADSSARPLLLAGHTDAVVAVTFSPDGRWLATGSRDKTIRLWDLAAGDPSKAVTTLTAAGPIRVLAFSPAGGRLVAASGPNLQLWDMANLAPETQPRTLAGHKGAIIALAFSADGRRLASGSADKEARVWDMTAADPAATVIVLRGHTDSVQTLAFSPDGRWIATGSADTTARVWDLNSANPADPEYILSGHEEPISAIIFTPDSLRVITASADTTARIWDLSTRVSSVSPLVLRGHTDQVFAIALSADGRWLVTGSRDTTARLWDLHDAHPDVAALVLRGHEGDVSTVAISPDGRWIATGSLDRDIRLWNLGGPDSPAAPRILFGHTSVVRAVPFSADGRRLITGSGDTTARIWDLNTNDPTAAPHILRGHQNALRAVVISPKDHWLATGGDDANIRLWDLSAPDSANTSLLLASPGATRAIAFSADERWMATGGRDGSVRLWDLSGGTPAATPHSVPGHTAQIRVIVFSPDNRWLATGGDDGAVRLWDLRAGDPTATSIELRGNTTSVRALAFSADGRWLASGGVDGSSGATAYLWDLTAQDLAAARRDLYPHKGAIRALAFSPDGHWLATGSADNTTRLWNMTSNPPAQLPYIELREHNDEVRAIAISADSHWLVTGSEDSTARLWNLKARDPRIDSIMLAGHRGPIWAVGISPDGAWIATGGQDATARLWRMTPLADATQIACRIAGRNLSRSEWEQYLGKGTPYRRTCAQWPAGTGAPEDTGVTQ
jgi:WD40 repeat protein